MESYHPNEMQLKILEAINCLVDEFVQNPFVFFNEADAVSELVCKLKNNIPQFKETFDFKNSATHTSLLHREYPASCFLKNGKGQEHFDLVILNPDYIYENMDHYAARPNKLIIAIDEKGFKPREVYARPNSFIAVIEFKLLYQGISNGRIKEIKKDIERLENLKNAKYCNQAYFVYLQRVLIRHDKMLSEVKKLRENEFDKCKIINIFNGVWSSEKGGDIEKIYKKINSN